MLESASSIIIALLAIILVVLVSHGFLLSRIARSLEKPPARQTRAAAAEPLQENHTPATLSDFDRFLAEDPARQQLSKKEQSAAYRAWRKEHGLTWNA